MSDRDTYRGQFAAYFAGQLSAEDAASLEAAFAHDATLAREAEAMRPVAEELARASAGDAADFRLSPDRLALIRAAASGHIVQFPGAPVETPVSSRRDVSLVRRLAPALAAAVAVVIGAVAGFTSGQQRTNADIRSWQVATQTEPAILGDADIVHFYPPAYGLDHHVAWPQRSASNVGFAASAPAYYGLPGPRPAFLIRGDSFILQ